MAIINGGPGDDDLPDNPAESDTISGFAGNDTITVRGGFDVAAGGDDIDRLIVGFGDAMTTISAGVTSGTLASGYSGSFSNAVMGVDFTGIEHFTIITGGGDDVI